MYAAIYNKAIIEAFCVKAIAEDKKGRGRKRRVRFALEETDDECKQRIIEACAQFLPSINSRQAAINSVRVCFKWSLQPHLDVFKLDKLYEKHTDHLLELLIKSKLKYTEHYRRYLNSYKSLKFSEPDINRLIMENYSKREEVHKRPLAKLYQDIAAELGLIKIK